jgi:hypothetical protein
MPKVSVETIQALARRVREIPRSTRAGQGKRRRRGREKFLAKLNGAADQSGLIWDYGFNQVRLNADRTVTFVPNGYSGAAVGPNAAWNLAEIGNTGTGLQMNGVDADTVCEGIDFQPAPDGKIVEMWYEYVHDQDPPYRAVFDYDNALDGVPV